MLPIWSKIFTLCPFEFGEMCCFQTENVSRVFWKENVFWAMSFRASQYKRDLELLERVQQRTVKMMKGWSIFPVRKGWELALLSPGMSINTWDEGAKRTEPGSLQWCPVKGSEAMGTTWKTGDSLSMLGNSFSLWAEHCHRLPREAVNSTSWDIFRDCLKMDLENLPWVALLEQQGWTRRLLESFPTSAMKMCYIFKEAFVYWFSSLLSHLPVLEIWSSTLQANLNL